MAKSHVVFKLLIVLCCYFCCSALKVNNKWKFSSIKVVPAALILSIGLCISPEVCSAYSYNEPVVIEKLDQNDGAADVFSGAFQASQLSKQTALKNNDYELVKQGLMKQSTAPRALKRRCLVSCKDVELRNKAQTDLGEKECVNKVLSGDMQFMLDVISK
jgi:hypothetical protein